ncbi:MAG: hypothetical protein HZB57_12860 [Gammaproteobacteria bacterium]|nr:hypothetical protein [Gammaproteobacteria bacterium]
MSDSKRRKKPYSDRILEEKITSNWAKTLGLFRKGEYSTVVIRAATSIELASNLLIKAELQHNRQLPEHFVEGLMMWANGLTGKVDRLLLPIFNGTDKEKKLKEIKERSKDINDERNNVVHRGQFKAKKTAERIISEAEFIINSFSSLAGSSLSVSADIDDEDEDI